MKVLIITALLCATSRAQIENARIALPLSGGKLLIVGGSIANMAYEKSMDSLPHAGGESPLQPFETLFTVPASYLARFRTDRETSWKPGDRWTAYPGAGAPLPAQIGSLAFGYYCGGIGGYVAAIAHFPHPAAAPPVAYLAAPGTGLPGVSSAPLVPALLVPVASRAAETLLRDLARAKIQAADLEYDPRVLRWSLPGRKPLLLIDAVWKEHGKPVFAAHAAVEEGTPPAVLAYDAWEGELMRQPEILAEGWKRPETSVFLNAWAVGKRSFVLIRQIGYEGSSVQLMEIVPGKGFVDSGIGFGSGC